MFCSSVIATIARPSLSQAVSSVLSQEFPVEEIEVIVVNDSGLPLPEASWQQDPRVRLLNTARREKSIARNTGAAVARGTYLHFLDDDDWLLPGALQALWELSQDSSAKLLYGVTQLIDRKGNPVTTVRHQLEGDCFVQFIAGEWIPLGSYLIESQTFFSVGGFNPLMPAGEDSDLCRRVSFITPIAGTPALVLCASFGPQGSSVDYSQLPEYSRSARETILDNPAAFTRMLGSASDSYWKGRIVRAYLTSAIWNLRHRRMFTAISRMNLAFFGVLLASRHTLSPRFWEAIARKHQSQAFVRDK